MSAYYVEKLGSTGDGSLLDHVIVIYGRGMSDALGFSLSALGLSRLSIESAVVSSARYWRPGGQRWVATERSMAQSPEPKVQRRAAEEF